MPELDPPRSTTSSSAIGQPAGEAGNNLGRAVAVLSGMDHLPGVTVNRYCSRRLQTTRMAFHAIKAGEGNAFISAGVETVSRFFNGWADNPEGQNPAFADAQAITEKRAGGGAETWVDPRTTGELPDLYIAMGQTAENVAQVLGMSREEQDEFGVRSQNLACAADRGGLLGPRDHTGHSSGRHRRLGRRRPAARHDARGGQPAQAGLPARRHASPPVTPAPSTTARRRSSS